MSFNDIPLLSMLKSHLGYLTERQRVISQNVANSDTPGYAPKELAPFQVHLDAQGAGGPMAPTLAPVTTATADSETRLDGNKVVLEEEMMKMNDARMNYSTTIDLYEKSMGMLQLAIRTPGKGG
jgi:flagellar basal-body rod protein FlgB